jgi:hypothetical protein
MLRKVMSIAKMISDIITVPIITINALFCNSDQVGHDTLCTNSFQVSSKYTFTFIL